MNLKESATTVIDSRSTWACVRTSPWHNGEHLVYTAPAGHTGRTLEIPVAHRTP